MTVYKLSEALRKRLSKPLGRLFASSDLASEEFLSTLRAPTVITVGDRVTEAVFALGKAPDIQVVDQLEMRHPRQPPDVPYNSLIRVNNPAGHLTEEAIRGICGAFKQPRPVRVLVTGEEDLLVLPSVARAPLGSSLYYGQPNEGIVFVKVDQDSKDSTRTIMKEMGALSIEKYDA
jgi:uncharacterized protein (UPF0218 family)